MENVDKKSFRTRSGPSKSVRRIEYLTESDDKGRCMFFLYWMANYHPGHPDGEYRVAERGQVFYADPMKYGFPRPEQVEDWNDVDPPDWRCALPSLDPDAVRCLECSPVEW